MTGVRFSLARFTAILVKEFVQMRRDRLTFGMMIGIPIMQLLLFGFAINADPRNLPTLVEMGDNGPLSRAVIAGMQNSSYFAFQGAVTGVGEGEEALVPAAQRGIAHDERQHRGNGEHDAAGGLAGDKAHEGAVRALVWVPLSHASASLH